MKADSHRIVLVGTYRPENETWIADKRLYNLPLPAVLSRKTGGTRFVASAKDGHLPFHESVFGVVLFAEGHQTFAFATGRDISDLPLDLAC